MGCHDEKRKERIKKKTTQNYRFILFMYDLIVRGYMCGRLRTQSAF